MHHPTKLNILPFIGMCLLEFSQKQTVIQGSNAINVFEKYSQKHPWSSGKVKERIIKGILLS